MSISSKDSNIIISTGTIVRFFMIVILLLALYYMSDVLLVVVAAIVIASAIEPIVRRLRLLKLHRTVAVIIVYVLIALVLATILIFFMPMVVSDTTEFLSSLPKTISLGQLWSPIHDLGTSFGSTSLSTHSVSVSDFINGLQSLIVGTGEGAFQTASAIFGGVLSFVLIVVLSFYLSVQQNGVDNFLRIITPVKHHDYIIDLWKRSQRKIGLWLQGQIILGIVVGVLVYLVLMIVGIPHALVLALFAGVLEIIPVFGPIISSVPAIIIAFSEAGVGSGVLLILLYIIIYQFESQLFYPLVVRKIVGISPIVVILALVIGAKFAGILGALIAVPLSAALMEYIDDIEKYKNAEVAERQALNNTHE